MADRGARIEQNQRLAVTVLVTYAVTIALGASVVQLLRRKGIVKARSTAPDYICLGSGSPAMVEGYPNTCAGIAGDRGLSSVVRVMVTSLDDPTPHLEVRAADDSGAAVPFAFRVGETRYGFIKPKVKTQ